MTLRLSPTKTISERAGTVAGAIVWNSTAQATTPAAQTAARAARGRARANAGRKPPASAASVHGGR